MAELFDEIAQALARRTGSEDTRVSEVIHAFFSGVERELLRGEKQSVPGLGQFQFKDGRIQFKPAKILRDWLVENTIPDGPIPENLLLNETQKSILQNLETSYPGMHGRAANEVSDQPGMHGRAGQDAWPSSGVAATRPNEASDLPELPALEELNLEQGKQDQAGESKPVVLASDLREATPESQTKDSAPTKQDETQRGEKVPAASSASGEVKKLKIILYSTIGSCALLLLLVAVFSIPWPKPQKIHFRDVKVPVSETSFYRIAIPPATSNR